MNRYFLSALLVFLLPLSAWAKDYVVSTPVTATTIEAAIADAYTNVATGPHNVVVPDGTYDDLGIVDVTAAQDAQSGKELTIKPTTDGGVTFTGEFTLKIKGDFWIVDGFIFDQIELVSGTHHRVRVIWFDAADDCQVTDCKFTNSGTQTNNPIDFIIRVDDDSDRTEIDHCYFYNNYAVGITQGHTTYNGHYHHNHLKGFTGPDHNSAIQVGATQNYYLEELETIIEYNLFEDCWGDTETISNKSSKNYYRYNVFLNTEALTLRHSIDCVVDSNWFIRTGANNADGIDVIFRGHTIVNNHFQGINGFTAIRLRGGNTENLAQVGGYVAAGDIDIVHNTFANCNSNHVIWFYDDTYAVNNIRFKNNIFHNTANDYVVDGGNGTATNLTWTTNLMYNPYAKYFKGLAAPESGITYSDPSFNQRNTTHGNIDVLPPTGSPALETATYDAVLATDDMDGHTRDNSTPDIGTDEYSTEPIVRLPVTEANVGPNWVNPTADQRPEKPAGLRIIH